MGKERIINANRYGYFKEILTNLGNSELCNKPTLKDIGMNCSQMTVAKRHMVALGLHENLHDYLCLLDTLELERLFRFLKENWNALAKNCATFPEQLKPFTRNSLKLFLLIIIQNESIANNFLRLFMRKPDFFLETEGGKEVIKSIKEEIREKATDEKAQKIFFEIISELWFQKITGTYNEEKFRSWIEELKLS